MVDVTENATSNVLLGEVANVLKKNNWAVDRWNESYVRDLIDYDLVISWDGYIKPGIIPDPNISGHDQCFVKMDFGWTSVETRLQVDIQPVGSMSPWSFDMYFSESDEGISKRNINVSYPHTVLVVIQDENEVNFKKCSPWFETNIQWLNFIKDTMGKNDEFIYWLWPVPGAEISNKLRGLVENTPNFCWLPAAHFRDVLGHVGVVLTINSNYAIQAIQKHMPVCCFGHSVYRYEHVVYCLQDYPQVFEDVMLNRVATKRCFEIYADIQDQMVDIVREHEWSTKTIFKRIKRLLDLSKNSDK